MDKIDLKKLLEPMEYKLRQGPGGKQLAYIDARQAQDRLDEVCGIENWKVEYKEHRGELFAGVSIKILTGYKDSYNSSMVNNQGFTENKVPEYEWVTKWDGGSETKIEGEKGVISDSFKRACVVWGLGRFLYSLDTKGTTPQTTPRQNNKEVKWYNNVDKNKDAWVDAIADGKTTAQAIVDKIEADGYRLSKANKETILAL